MVWYKKLESLFSEGIINKQENKKVFKVARKYDHKYKVQAVKLVKELEFLERTIHS